MNLVAYKTIYDFAAIERAVQSFFVAQEIFAQPPDEADTDREAWSAGADHVAFFTAFEAAIFEKSTPRVSCFLTDINNFSSPGHFIVDNNGALRNNIWRGTLTLEIVTSENYTLHTDLRSTVQALAEMIAPQVVNPADLIGANQHLTNHQINYVVPQNLDTTINRGEGFFVSQLNFQITFSVPAGAIAAVAE